MYLFEVHAHPQQQRCSTSDVLVDSKQVVTPNYSDHLAFLIALCFTQVI